MGHIYTDGEWYVDGDSNPYDTQDEAQIADQAFWTNPSRYVATADPMYPPPDAFKRTAPRCRDNGCGLCGNQGWHLVETRESAWIERCESCRQLTQIQAQVAASAQAHLHACAARYRTCLGPVNWAIGAVAQAANDARRVLLTPSVDGLFEVFVPENNTFSFPIGFVRASK